MKIIIYKLRNVYSENSILHHIHARDTDCVAFLFSYQMQPANRQFVQDLPSQYVISLFIVFILALAFQQEKRMVWMVHILLLPIWRRLILNKEVIRARCNLLVLKAIIRAVGAVVSNSSYFNFHATSFIMCSKY